MKYPYSKHFITNENISSVLDAMQNYNLTQGELVDKFENDLANYLNCKDVIVCSSGTAALHLIYNAIGVNETKGILTSPITFMATANAAKFLNANVYFSDVNPETGILSKDSVYKDLKKLKGKIKALVIVHLGSKICNIEEFRNIADEFNIHLIEDACHVIGHKFISSKNLVSFVGSGNFSLASSFSFHAIKNITTGEGGAIATNNTNLAKRIRLLRSHAVVRDQKWNDKLGRGPWYYESKILGYNYRLTDFQAALGISQLKNINDINKNKNYLANIYNNLLKDIKHIKLPDIKDQKFNQTWHLYSINLDFKKIGKTRNQIMRELIDKEIGTQVHYIPLYKQKIYKSSSIKNYKNTEKYYNTTLSLPMYTGLKDKDIKYIVNSLINIIS